MNAPLWLRPFSGGSGHAALSGNLALAAACLVGQCAAYAALSVWAGDLVATVSRGPGLAGRVGAGLLLVGASALLTFLQGIVLARLALDLLERLRASVLRATVLLPLAELRRGDGRLAPPALLADLTGAQEALLRGALLFVPNGIALGALVAGLFAVAAPLAAFVLASAVPFALVLHAVGRRMRRAAETRSSAQSAFQTLLSDLAAGAREVRLLGLQREAESRLATASRDLRGAAVAEEVATHAYPLATTLLSALVVAALILLSARLLGAGTLTREALAAFFTCLGLSSQHLQNVTASLPQATRLLHSARKLALALGDPEPDTRPDLPAATRADEILELEDLAFSYPGGPEVLRGASLTVRSGEVVALLAPSGAGKSTLFDLAAGLARPASGRVTLAGHDLALHSARSVAARIGLVSQEPVLFAGTLLRNIALGAPEAAEEEVLEAARKAGVDDVAVGRPGGYAARLGPSGAGLSTGERQRVALARALLRRPAVLLLDEPTAALDEDAERRLYEAVLALSPRPAILVAAHRPLIRSLADRVVTLVDGRIQPQHAVADPA